MAKTTEQQLLYSIGDTLKETISPTITVLIDTAAKLYTGPFFAITAMQDSRIDISECAINMLERNPAGGTRAITSDLVIPQGMTIHGNFSTIELQSGLLIGYAKAGSEINVEA